VSHFLSACYNGSLTNPFRIKDGTFQRIAQKDRHTIRGDGASFSSSLSDLRSNIVISYSSTTNLEIVKSVHSVRENIGLLICDSCFLSYRGDILSHKDRHGHESRKQRHRKMEGLERRCTRRVS
jgi:hypothetical protein